MHGLGYTRCYLSRFFRPPLKLDIGVGPVFAAFPVIPVTKLCGVLLARWPFTSPPRKHNSLSTAFLVRAAVLLGELLFCF